VDFAEVMTPAIWILGTPGIILIATVVFAFVGVALMATCAFLLSLISKVGD